MARGARLAALGDCISCHTVPGGAPFAGGRAVQTPFGAVYAGNITPDPTTGIGTWSAAAFRRAMHDGVDRAGHQLYPAFPYDHFTRVSDADDADLYAYLATREPVQATNPPNDLSFPLGFRSLIAGWKLLFFRHAAFQPDTTQSAAWNRGAYLVQGLAHCGACHTPRNLLGAEKSGRPLDGGEAQGWSAYALDAAAPAPASWTADTIYDYLRHGWQPRHGVALGPMGEVTHDLAGAPDDDVRAIATYVAAQIGTPRPRSAPPPPPAGGPGEALYHGACAACHEGGRGPPLGGIDLALSSALHAPDPANLADIVVGGIPATGEEPAPIMPGFGAALTDRQIVDLLTWLRARFGAPQPWDGIQAAVQAARDTTALREAAQ
ncbi:MAG: cytochrome c [Acetobacteraceae bacterium]